MVFLFKFSLLNPQDGQKQEEFRENHIRLTMLDLAAQDVFNSIVKRYLVMKTYLLLCKAVVEPEAVFK